MPVNESVDEDNPMRKYTFAVPAVALALASACADTSPTGVDFAPSLSSIAEHGTIPAPDMTATVTGSDVRIDWTWSDTRDWDLVSFQIVEEDEQAAEVDEIDNAKPYASASELVRSHTFEGLEDGTYTFCVEVMAKNDGSPAVTHHNRSCETVTVGAAYTINVIGGSAGNLAFNRNAANFNVAYELLLNGSVVTDCTAEPIVEPAGLIKQHNCDPATGARNVVFENPDRGTSMQVIITWSYPVAEIGQLTAQS
jgi:hypothetical protein